MAYAFIALGVLLLTLGSETVLRGGIGLSRVFGLPPLLIGLTVVSLGTSAPALAVMLQASLHNAPDLGLAGIIGSNVVNVLLILGLCALVRPMPVAPKIVLRDGSAMVLATLLLVVFAVARGVTAAEGALLLGGFVVYAAVSFVTDFRRPGSQSGLEARALLRGETSPGAAASILLLGFGSVCLYAGSTLVVGAGLRAAQEAAVSPALVGLTIIGLGISLPVLITALAARAHSGIGAGHLIAANIFNILVVVGIAALLHPLPISAPPAPIDLAVLAASACLVPLLLVSRWQLSRLQGLFLMLSYVAYLGFLAWRQGYLPAMIAGL